MSHRSHRQPQQKHPAHPYNTRSVTEPAFYAHNLSIEAQVACVYCVQSRHKIKAEVIGQVTKSEVLPLPWDILSTCMAVQDICGEDGKQAGQSQMHCAEILVMPALS